MSQLEQIKKQHQKGHLKKAIEGYQGYLKKNPNDDDAHFALALAYKDNKAFKQALTEVNEALKLAPSAERYHQFKGQMHMALGNTDEALKAFRESLKNNPNLYFSYLALGDIYLIREQFQDAEEQYRLAMRVHQEAAPGAVKLAKLMLILGRTEEADSVLQAAALHHADDPEIKLYQGVVCLETGELAYAEMHFKKLLEDHPKFNLAKAFLAISIINDDQKQAAKLLNDLIETGQQSPELMAATALLSFKQKQFQEAADYLMTVCRSSLAYPSWFITLSQTLVAMNRLDQAQQVLHRLLERGKNDRATIMLALIDIRKEQFSKAIDRLHQIDKDSPLHHTAVKHLMQAHHRSKQWSYSLKAADTILSNNPAHKEAVVIKAYAQYYLSNTEQAIDTLNQALSQEELAADADDLHLYTGLLLDETGDYEAAWKHFSTQQKSETQSVSLLSQAAEKQVQKWPVDQQQEQQPVFVFSDTATGHVAFVDRLNHHGITALTDRFQPSARMDLFSQRWQFEDIANLPDARCHLLRKKYRQHLKRRHETGAYADFIPISALNMALIKKVFPAATVIVLDRNMPDRHLHQAVFGNSAFSATDFGRIKNQLIAMSPNVNVVDIDALMTNEEATLDTLERIFATEIAPWESPEIIPMERFMLPKDRWKAYQAYLKPDAS